MRYLTLLVFPLSLSCSFGFAQDAAREVLQLGLSGNAAFTDKQIRSSVLLDPVCVMPVRERGLAGAIDLIAARVRDGYVHRGYAAATVEPDRKTLQLKIAESRRYRFGEISVMGESPVPRDEIAAAIQADGGWPSDTFVSLPVNRKKLINAATSLFEKYGYFGPSFKVDTNRNVGTAAIDLVVKVEAGPRSVTSGVAVSGFEDVAFVRSLVGSVPGQSPTPQMLQQVRGKLAACEKFQWSQVSLSYPIAPGAATQLEVTLSKRLAATPSDSMDDETVVQRFSRWLDDWSAGRISEDLVVDFRIPQGVASMPIVGRAVLSNSAGVCLMIGEDPGNPAVSVTSSGGVLEAVAWAARERFRIRPATFVGDLELKNAPPGSADRTSFLGSGGVNNSIVARPIRLAIDTEVILRELKAVGGDAGNHLSLLASNASLEIEKATGRLIDFHVSSSDGNASLRVKSSAHAAEESIAMLRNKSAEFREAETLSHLAGQAVVAVGLPDYLAQSVGGLWALLRKEVDSVVAFRIPVEVDSLIVSMSQREAVLMWLAGRVAERAPLDSKEFTLLRAVAMRSLGHRELAAAITEPYGRRPDSDPVNCWLAAIADPANRQALAKRGLEGCSVEEVSRSLQRYADLLSLAIPQDEPVSQRLTAYLANLLSSELSALGGPPAAEISVLDRKKSTKKKAEQAAWWKKPLDTTSFADQLRRSRRNKARK